jgi:membrane protein required for colicin V production
MEFFSSLVGFDWLVLLIVGVTAVFGVMRGFISEVFSLAAWVAGVAAVRFFYRPARALLEGAGAPDTLAAMAAVIGPFLLALLVVKLIGHLISSATKDSMIGPFDRLLGLGFGVLKGVLAAGLLFLLTSLALKLMPGEEPPPDWLAKAKSAPTLALVAGVMVNYVGEAWQERGQERGQPAGENPHKGLPGFGEDDPAAGSYGEGDRNSLDKLLDDQEKQTPSTPI